MSTTSLEQGKLDIGRVIQQLFQVLGRNFASFFVLALVLIGTPSAVINYLQLSSVRPGELPQIGMGVVYAGLAALILSAILQASLIYATVQDLSGQKKPIGDSLATGLRAFLPLILLTILLSLGIGLGFVLLIVPGVMLACAWCVAVPVLVAERRGVFETFGRSADLTRGNRWRIFALFLLYLVAAIVVSAVIGAFAGVGAAVAALQGGFSPIFAIVNALGSAVTAVVGATGVAVLYVELRQAREGTGAEALAEVFS